MYVKLNGDMVYLWGAVDHEGKILESYITKTRDKDVALTFMKKALKRRGLPEAITTDSAIVPSGDERPRQCREAGGRTLGQQLGGEQPPHLPKTRTSDAQLPTHESFQKFASVHANVHNHFNLERHLVDRQTFKERRSAALAEWQMVAS